MIVLSVGRSVGAELPVAAAIAIGAGAVIGTAAPAAPGYVGTYELAALAGGASVGIAPEVVLPIALVLHLIGLVTLSIAGAVAMARLGGRAGIGCDLRPIRTGWASPPMNPTAGGGRPPLPPLPSSRSSCPCSRRARRSSPSCGRWTPAIATPHEILVVYDFDEDPTVPVIDRLAAELPAVRGLRNDLGRGVLNAMKAGIAGVDRATTS